MAADLVLCMHAEGEGCFAEDVLQKLEEKERLSLLLAQKKEEKEQKKRSVPPPTQEDIKPSPTKKTKKEKEEEAPKKQRAKKARFSTHDDAQVSSVVSPRSKGPRKRDLAPMIMLRCLQ